MSFPPFPTGHSSCALTASYRLYLCLTSVLAIKGREKSATTPATVLLRFGVLALKLNDRWYNLVQLLYVVSGKLLPSLVHCLINAGEHFWLVYFTVLDFLAIQAILYLLGYNYL